MDRLTKRDEYGNADIAELWEMNAVTNALNRLAAYEDTGLTPEEITALIADNKRLHGCVDIIENTIKTGGIYNA